VLITNTGTVGETAEHRQQLQRFHDDEEHDKEFQQLIEHDALRETFLLILKSSHVRRSIGRRFSLA
jgi:hypothetical protein